MGNRAYYVANRDRVIARATQYYRANRARVLARVKKRREENREAILEWQAAYRAERRSELNAKQAVYRKKNRSKVLSSQRRHYKANREAILRSAREFRVGNGELIRDKAKEYRAANREKINARARQARLNDLENYRARARAYSRTPKWRQTQAKWRKERKARDQHFRILTNLRSRISLAIREGGAKRSARTAQLVGCDIPLLMAWLAAKFQPGMNWNNYGKWHIDHIKPCASFDLTDPKQQQACFHYSNLQPLWAADNIRKKAKITANI